MNTLFLKFIHQILSYYYFLPAHEAGGVSFYSKKLNRKVRKYIEK